MAKRACKGTTKKGKPCKASPLTDRDVCLAHADEETRRSTGFVPDNGKGGRPKLPTPTEVARKLIEDNIVAVLAPHFRTLGYELETVDDARPRLVKIEHGGAKLHGTSQRDGEIKMSPYDDLGAMIAAAEKLLDRIYGRPKQVSEITGEDGGPIAHAFDLSKLTEEELRELRRLTTRAEH